MALVASVVDENVDPALLGDDALDQCFDLGIVAAVAVHSDAGAASPGDSLRRCMNGAGYLRIAIGLRTAGDVDGAPVRAQCQRNALSRTATGARDDRDASSLCQELSLHSGLTNGLVSPPLVHSIVGESTLP